MEENCPKCLEEIGEDFVQVEEDKFHINCFQCDECSKLIAEIGYEKVEQNYYCEDCYVDKYAPDCSICHQKITGMCAEIDEQKIHAECFKCAQCNEQLEEDYFQVEDGFQCANCKNETSKVCDKCKQLIQAELISALQKHYHRECFLCNKCQKPIGTEPFVQDDGEPQHENCVSRCEECGEMIDNDDFFQKNNTYYHSDCYAKKRQNEKNKQKEETKQEDKIDPVLAQAKSQLKPKMKDLDQKTKPKVEENKNPYENVIKGLKAPVKTKPDDPDKKEGDDKKVFQPKQVPHHKQSNRKRYAYEQLISENPPKGIDITKKEAYLSDDEFNELFKMTLKDFQNLKEWKQKSLKAEKKLF